MISNEPVRISGVCFIKDFYFKIFVHNKWANFPSGSGGGTSGGVLPKFHQFIQDKFASDNANFQEITHERFVQLLTEINNFSEKSLDIDGNQLVFAVKKGTDSTLLWRSTVQIACVKFNKNDQKIVSYRLLTLNEFLAICKTLKWQNSAVVQSKRNQASNTEDDNDGEDGRKFENSKECCICLERQHEVILPCAHSYCLPCIEQWNEIHDTCPICRQKLDSLEEIWELPGIPTVSEINNEIQTTLMDLTRNRNC